MANKNLFSFHGLQHLRHQYHHLELCVICAYLILNQASISLHIFIFQTIFFLCSLNFTLPWIFFDQGTLHMLLLFHGAFAFHVTNIISLSFLLPLAVSNTMNESFLYCFSIFISFCWLSWHSKRVCCSFYTFRSHIDRNISYKKTIFIEFPNVLVRNQFILIEHKAIESNEFVKKGNGIFCLLPFVSIFLRKMMNCYHMVLNLVSLYVV